MNIYKLQPIDLSYAGWKYSCHTKPVIVRAETEIQARLAAAKSFGKAAEVVFGADTVCEPWTYTPVVSATILFDSKYPIDGVAEVLEPKPEY